VFYNVDPSEMKNKRSILENICIYNHGEYRKVVGVEGSSKKSSYSARMVFRLCFFIVISVDESEILIYYFQSYYFMNFSFKLLFFLISVYCRKIK
jgi:hypothetical protein